MKSIALAIVITLGVICVGCQLDKFYELVPNVGVLENEIGN